MEFLNALEPLLKIFWYVAIAASVLFIIQTIMTFVGMDGSDGVEADFDGDLGHDTAPGQYFSFRNFINFLLGFSWTGVLFYDKIESKALLVAFAVLVGLSFLLAFFYILKQMKKLAEDNSTKIEQALGKTAEVYLSIPARKTGKGKILVSIQGSTKELYAVSEGDTIPTSASVKIIGIENESTLIVEQNKI